MQSWSGQSYFDNSSWIQQIASAMQNVNKNPGHENAAQFVIYTINYFDCLYDFWTIILV